MTQPKTASDLAEEWVQECVHSRFDVYIATKQAFLAGHAAGIARCLELLRGSDPSDSHALNPENGFLELCETGIEWSAWLESQLKEGGGG